MADIEMLFRDYYGFIYKFLLSRCRNADIAEELTQETFYRAFINQKQLRDDSAAVYWLCSIAKNLLYRHFKESARFCDTQEDSDIISPSDTAQEAEDRVISEKVLKAARALDEPYREVFLLSTLGNMPLSDISRTFGKSESWARVTLYRAKEKIIKELDL
ncbi:MAG: sigma-70 family RNA polymerase sigma factor [Clostridia bacterium]|nr:sigma-70 family RNA polymerase sigma factor [Clostridia bacterium]